MIGHTHLWFVLVYFCFVSGQRLVHSIALNKSAQGQKTDSYCQKLLDGPDWTINNLKNVSLDSWPWSCLLSRYTHDALNILVTKAVGNIYAAAKRGDIGFVQYYAKKNDFLKYVNVKELLYKTAEGGDFRILRYLLEEQGLQVDVKDQKLLLSSAVGGNVDLIKYLIYEKNLTRNATDNLQKNTALHNAALAGKLDATRFFVENLNYKVDARNAYDETPSLLAVEGGHLAILKYLIEEKHANLSVRSDFGTSLLHSAAYRGHLAIVKYLVEQKHFNVELRDNSEKTPLQDAVLGGQLNVVKYLVNEGKTNIYTVNSFNRSLLHQAVAAGNNLEVMKYLIDELNMSSRIEDEDLANSTVAMFAAQEGALPILKFLVEEKNASISTVDSLRHNLLHAAARENQLAVVKYLVEEQNFDVSEAGGNGGTAYNIAINYKAPGADIRQLLDYLQEKLKKSTRSFFDIGR